MVHADGNLPAEVTSFVGRRRELTSTKRALARSRLVTLTGVGGVGKTRVAERVARDRRRAYPHGVWLVELAELSDPALLTETLLTVLGVPSRQSGDDLAALIDFLASRHLLLVLDNCEHMLDEVAALSTTLLRSCPDLQILATSRAPLRVVGEAVVSVPPMAVPDPERGSSLAGLLRYDAVALFVERAAAAVPNFVLNEDNYRSVASLCYRLDGLPLTIELATGRLGSLSPEQILSKFEGRYSLLSGIARGRPERQQTLQACLEWSYQLCSPQEQRLWARLSVFSGSFELDAVEAVCAEDIAAAEIVDLISSLVDKSIVVRHERGAVVRYRLLEAIREFGSERLAEAGGSNALRARHLTWCAALVHSAKAEWISERQVYWLSRLAADAANIRSALEFCLHELGDVDKVMEILVQIPLGCYWAQGTLGEVRHFLDAALAASTGDTTLRVRAILLNCILAMVGGEFARGDELFAEALDLSAHMTDPLVLAQLHHAAAFAVRQPGELSVAIAELEQARAISEGLPDLDSHLDILQSLAYFGSAAGQHERATAWGEEIIALTEPRGESMHRANALMTLGLDAWRQGDPARAVELQHANLEIRLGLGDRNGTALSLEALAWGVGALGQHKRAAHLLGAAEALWETTGGSMAILAPELLGEHDNGVAAARNALGDRVYAVAFRRGTQMTPEQVLTESEYSRCSAQSGQAPSAVPGATPLTRREAQIAALLAQGLSNKAIAKTLVIAQRTAETHVANILVKLGLNSRGQVAAWVADHGEMDSSEN